MSKKIKGRKFLMADFETSTAEWLIHDNGVARVWLWGLYDIESNNFEYGTDINSFIERTLTYHSKMENPIIYFHNLKFDGSYIVNYLLSNGYIFDNDLSDINHFKTSISDMGQWYFIEVCIYKRKKQKIIVRFQDSLKKLVLPVKDLPKAFGFENEEEKGEIDYNIYRPVGYKPTQKELYYIYRDLTIPARCLKILEEEGCNKITVSSDSFYQWKLSIMSDKAKERNILPETNYRRYFPALSEEEDKFCRNAYRGGFCYVNPKYQGIILNNIDVYDINSMYPSKLKFKYLPIGKPRYFEGKPIYNKYECFIVRIMICFDLKPNHIPCIQLKNSYAFNPTDYITSSNGSEIEMTITNIDLNLIFKQYNVSYIKYIDGYIFRKTKGFFDAFIDENMKIKETSTGGKRLIAKRRLNTVYGKTGTAQLRFNKIPYLEDGVLKFHLDKGEIEEGEYLPIAIFVTSHARHDIILDAQKNYDNFVYCDTDSLHLLHSDSINLPIHETHLGYYKLESKARKAIFLRPKTYIEEDYDGVAEIKCAGANDATKKNMNFENFRSGQTFEGKLMSKQVKGGCVLMPSLFTIE